MIDTKEILTRVLEKHKTFHYFVFITVLII